MSLFKKLFSSSDSSQAAQAAAAAATSASMPAGIQTMKQDLQKKFARGVQYNMKVIIKGDRNVGKTTMWRRLQGEKFAEDYVSTEQIQVGSISWSYKVTDDVVKVEVWDVVDKGKRRKKPATGLKLIEAIAPKKAGNGNTQSNGPQSNASGASVKNAPGTVSNEAEDASADAEDGEPVLDAEWVDVYKGTHAVFLLFDMTKSWTFAYVEQELSRIPSHLPVLVLGNHRDMGHHRTVSDEQARYAIESLDRPPGAAPVRYTEMSLRNGFGLRFVYQFLNLPFLLMQRENLLHALETNSKEVEASLEELETQDDSDTNNYDRFSDVLTQQRRATQEQLGTEAIRREREKQAAAALQQQQQANATSGVNLQRNSSPNLTTPSPVPVASTAAPPQSRAPQNAPTPSSSTAPSTPTPPPVVPAVNVPSKLKMTEKANEQKAKSLSATQSNDAAKKKSPVTDIDNFVAESDAGALNDFLDEDVKTTQSSNVVSSRQLDSDDETSDRPVIQALAEDLDPQDELTLTSITKSVPVQPELSSESDSEEVSYPTETVQTAPLSTNFLFARNDSVNSGVDETQSDVAPVVTPVLTFDANDLDALEALGGSRQNSFSAAAAAAAAANQPEPSRKAKSTKKVRAKRSEENEPAGETPKPKTTGTKKTAKKDPAKRKAKTVRSANSEYDEL